MSVDQYLNRYNAISKISKLIIKISLHNDIYYINFDIHKHENILVLGFHSHIAIFSY